MHKASWTVPMLVVALLAFGCGDCQREEAPPVDWEIQSVYQRGNMAMTDGNFKVAEKEFRRVLAKDGKHLGALTKLARSLEGRAEKEPALREQLLADAVDMLNKASGIDPESKVVWSALARVARKAAKPDQAIAALRRILAIDPAGVEILIGIAEIEEQRGRVEQAEVALKSGLAGDTGPLRLALGRLLLRLKRADEAQKILEQIQACPKPKEDLVKPEPCPTAAYYESQDELGALAVRQGRHDDARKVYSSLVQMFPEDYMAWEVLAALDEKEGKWVEAEEKYRQSLAIDRAHMSVWRGLGRALASQNQIEDAIYAYRKADNFLARSPAQAADMSDELVALGDRVWAKSLLERARILLQGQGKAGIDRIDEKLKRLAAAANEAKPDGGAAAGGDP